MNWLRWSEMLVSRCFNIKTFITQSMNISAGLETPSIMPYLTHRNLGQRSSTTNRPWRWRNEKLFSELEAELKQRQRVKENMLTVQSSRSGRRCPSFRREIDYERRAYTRHLGLVVRDRDLIPEELKRFRNMCEISEMSVQFLMMNVHTLSHQLKAA